MNILQISIIGHILFLFVLTGCADAEQVMEPVTASANSDENFLTENSSDDSTAKSGGGTAVNPALKRKMVTEGLVNLSVETVESAINVVKVEVLRIGGQISSEQMAGATESARSGTLKVRVPPQEFEKFMTWLAVQGEVTHRQLDTQDVSRQYFDQDLALENLSLTMKRLQALLNNSSIKMAEILEVEKEMTRIRGDIERIKGAQRFLNDRISLATLTVEFQSKSVAIPSRSTTRSQMIGPKYSVLGVTGSDVTDYVGYGGQVKWSSNLFVDVDLLQPNNKTGKAAILATVGNSYYSAILASSQRSWLNPWLSWRFGYAFIEERRALLGVDIGLELYRKEWISIDLSGRFAALMGNTKSSLGRQYGLSVLVPF